MSISSSTVKFYNQDGSLSEATKPEKIDDPNVKVNKNTWISGYTGTSYSYEKRESSGLKKAAVVVGNVALLGLGYLFDIGGIRTATRRVLFGEAPIAEVNGKKLMTYHTETKAPEKKSKAELKAFAEAAKMHSYKNGSFVIDEANSCFIIIPHDEHGDLDYSKIYRRQMCWVKDKSKASYTALEKMAKVYIVAKDAIEKTANENGLTNYCVIVRYEEGNPQLYLTNNIGINTNLNSPGHKVESKDFQKVMKELLEGSADDKDSSDVKDAKKKEKTKPKSKGGPRGSSGLGLEPESDSSYSGPKLNLLGRANPGPTVTLVESDDENEDAMGLGLPKVSLVPDSTDIKDQKPK